VRGWEELTDGGTRRRKRECWGEDDGKRFIVNSLNSLITKHFLNTQRAQAFHRREGVVLYKIPS
jgi:hypothetical protein